MLLLPPLQDRQCLYLVMDFHPGGDLLTVMERQEGGMAEEDAKFYLAEIAMGLNDLHQLGYVYMHTHWRREFVFAITTACT